MTLPRRTRKDGRHSRDQILETAARLATLEGLEGLSIARLAQAAGMSKSGVYAHFDSKEDLQLATVDTASAIYEREVTGPALVHTRPIDRLRAFCAASLSYTERKVFPGGCFFVSSMTEFRARQSPIHARLQEIQRDWMAFLEGTIAEARDDGDLPPSIDVGRLAFELASYLLIADLLYLLDEDYAALEHARAAVADRIGTGAAVASIDADG